MDVLVGREDVWAAGLDDKPGALAAKLSALTEAGADLDFIVVRRTPEKPGSGVVFVTPLQGDREVRAAASAGFLVTSKLHSVRVEGDNEPGAATKVSKAIGDAGINMRGFSAAVLGTKFVVHVGVDSAEDEEAAVRVLSEL
ncbi:MAG: ACT domain-containing protein [Actinobacteria bacterium]|nr:ACT domain-containing protein [Actinomycetota bacterium]